MNTLDWDKVEKFIQERQPVSLDAGLLDDWFWTAATVYENGEWKDRDAAYVTSYWATPGFKAELPNGDTVEVVASREQTLAEAEAHKALREKKMAEAKETLSRLRQEVEA